MDVRDPIHGNIALSDAEVAILDSKAYQRLRQIKQLGFSEFSFPGATHNRYLHSLGVCHLAGVAFDNIFARFAFSSEATRRRLRQSVRLAAMLHDIGHGPLSHASEEVMPKLADLKVDAYQKRAKQARPDQQADHEDYTIKFITGSSLTEELKRNFSDIEPYHIACLIDKSLILEDDFFIEGGFDFRTILSQIVSSEMDVDRMDYLERDAYFCGTNYGKVELNWLLANMTYHPRGKQLHLALNRRALYTFDDFLLARHHMHLMVYFHHKSIIYEELLYRYFTSADCAFKVPSDIEEYIACTDYALWRHLSKVPNEWARRMVERKPFRMLFEMHSNNETDRPTRITAELEKEGIPVIHSSSQARLSKYHSGSEDDKALQIYVVDKYDFKAQPYPIEETTEIFHRYEDIRRIDRIYVPPEEYDRGEKILINKRI
ncbi:MAG: HD domain-containing protein [Bdellovibrionales bacterium]|nr:HD domain-containing protein [Bdellovibrionales bacterium]